MSSRTSFGICPSTPVARNVGQTLNQSCSPREKRHREKRGFRLVPLLARAVQGDNFLSLRAVADRAAILSTNAASSSGLPRSRWSLAMTPPVKAASCLGCSLKSHVQPLWMALSAFTMAARLGRSTESRAINGLCAYGRRIAFTMAEILLSLTIIGVVAAITLPSLTGNINERTWNTQRKALYARFSQAIALMPAMNGYGTLDSSDTHNVTETFLTAGLTKVLKINNICNKDSLPDCGIASLMTNAQGSKMDIPVKISDLYSKNINVELFGSYSGSSVTYADINAAAFETANGESILAFYNPNCNAKDVLSVENALHIPEKMCANFIYDLNGTKGPNTFGKDIGIISVFYPTDSVVVAPMPFLRGGDLEVNWSEANSSCKNIDSEYRAPNLEEMMALQYNHNVSNLANTRYWTNSREGENAWQVTYTNKGMLSPVDSTVEGSEVFSVRCVKR